MCGRFYIDEDLTDKVLRDLRAVFPGRLTAAGPDSAVTGVRRDVCPSEGALAVRSKGAGGPALARIFWGFPRFDGKGLLINARSETAAELPSFRAAFEHDRCVIPASGFYEWDREKRKASFTAEGQEILYLGALTRRFPDLGAEADRFTILTCAANESMLPYHHRMPLILTADEILPWIGDRAAAEELLHKPLPEVTGRYEA